MGTSGKNLSSQIENIVVTKLQRERVLGWKQYPLIVGYVEY